MEYVFQSFDFDKLIGVTGVYFNCVQLYPECAGATAEARWTWSLSLLEVIYKIILYCCRFCYFEKIHLYAFYK